MNFKGMRISRFIVMVVLAMVAFAYVCAECYASSSWETELNDARPQADHINVNQGVSGNLLDEYDEDYYCFTTTTEGTVQVNFSHDYVADEAIFWEISLTDETGNTYTKMNVRGVDTNLQLQTVGLPQGTYYIIVNDYNIYDDDYSNATYTVTAAFCASTTWETERNESRPMGDVIRINEKYNGNLLDEYDEDYYRFTISTAGIVQVNFTHDYVADEAEFWEISLTNEDGKEYARESARGVDTNIQLQTVGLPQGTYYIVVNDENTYDDDYSGAKYGINVKFTTSKIWEREWNDTRPTATLIDVNKYFKGNLLDEYDEDYYRINLSKKQRVTVKFKHNKVNSEMLFWEIKLTDADGNVYTSETISGTDTETNLTTTSLPAGTYYVVVNDENTYDDDYSGTTYSINAMVPATVAPKRTTVKLSAYDKIRFSWSKVSGADGYYVYMKKASASKWTSLGTTKKTYVIKKGLAKGTKYQFKVVPYKTLSDGNYKGLEKKSKTIYTLKRIAKPTVKRVSGKYVEVKWKDLSGESGYQIYKMKKANGKYKKVSSYKTTKAYKKIKAAKGKTYYYKVRAYKKVGDKTIYAPWSKIRSYKLKK